MKQVMLGLLTVVLFACQKKENGESAAPAAGAVRTVAPVCKKEILTDKPVKVGETGIMLPAGTKLCFSADDLEIRVELPAGFAFMTKEAGTMDRTLPIFATYSCNCSASGSACQVFYAEGLGFGCLQSTCSGSCTGKFTYKGYSVDRVAYTDETEKLFALPEVQDAIATVAPSEGWREFSMYGVKFAVVHNEKAFLEKASCDCEGTQACKLKTISIPFIRGAAAGKKIYYCAGGCNGCELTVG